MHINQTGKTGVGIAQPCINTYLIRVTQYFGMERNETALSWSMCIHWPKYHDQNRLKELSGVQLLDVFKYEPKLSLVFSTKNGLYKRSTNNKQLSNITQMLKFHAPHRLPQKISLYTAGFFCKDSLQNYHLNRRASNFD